MSRRRVVTVVGAGLTVALLWWTLRDVSASEVLAEISTAEPLLLLAAVAVATFSFVLRALRWHVLLLPRFDQTSFGSRFGATCVGFMANNLLPARIGEFARAATLTRAERVPLAASLASLVVERIFDGVILAVMLFGTMVLPGFPGISESGAAVQRTATVAAALFGAGMLVLWAMVHQPGPALKAFEHSVGRLLPTHLTDRAISALASFIEGLGALHRPGVFLAALGWTVAVWICLASSLWLGLLAFGIDGPGLAGSMFLQAVIAFAVALPSTPGFFGLFEAAARVGLTVYGVSATQIVSFATSYHILTFVPVTILGLVYVRSFGLSWSDLRRGDELVEASISPGGQESEANPGDPDR
ncbi:MAG: lysylphosphatidylglycerol synthase transmembrane domain-containing protein [Gemmatimonadota bacterium]